MSIAYEALATWNKMLGLQNPSETRDKECAQIYKDLDESLKVINQNPLGVTYAALSEVQMIMHKIKEKSVNALRGIFNVSSLHDKAIKLVDEFDSQLKANKDQIFAQQNEMLKNQTEEIKQLSENRAREQRELKTENAELKIKQAATEEKLAEMKEKLSKSEAENAEIKKTLEILLKRTRSLAVAEEETIDSTTKTNAQFFRR
jgi:ATP-dependent Clp protease ATP-binding subunit ClpA